VDDCVDPLDGPCDRVGVADVADEELDLRAEVFGPLGARVDLRREVVERADAVAVREQFVGEVRADEAGAAGDEDCPGDGGTLAVPGSAVGAIRRLARR
jgi:hypothetical protein